MFCQQLLTTRGQDVGNNRVKLVIFGWFKSSIYQWLFG